MVLKRVQGDSLINLTSSCKRRIRRKKARIVAAKSKSKSKTAVKTSTSIKNDPVKDEENAQNTDLSISHQDISENNNILVTKPIMSAREAPRSREEVMAERQAKKIAKQKGKSKEVCAKENILTVKVSSKLANDLKANNSQSPLSKQETKVLCNNKENKEIVTKDEVDKAVPSVTSISNKTVTTEKSKEDIQAARLAKKLAKREGTQKESNVSKVTISKGLSNEIKKSVANTIEQIVDVAKEVREVSAKLDALKVDETIKKQELGKSKAELRAERRAKQETQRAAKLTAVQVTAKAKTEKAAVVTKLTVDTTVKEEKKPEKSKVTDKSVSKVKTKRSVKVKWFQQMYNEWKEATNRRVKVNNHLHPAVVKLGVQLASRVVTGANARCIALLNALKQVVKDYTLPAKTEYARGLDAYLVTCLNFLWSMRKPSTTQTNAVTFFRYQLTQLPNNINEFEAKSTLQEAIDTYIREQIDMAGQAISLSVRKKIQDGDTIITSGCSSLVERCLKQAWQAGVRFSALALGAGGRGLARRLRAAGVPSRWAPLAAAERALRTPRAKLLLGAAALLAHGRAASAAGAALLARAARAHGVPLLLCCERHKVSSSLHSDALSCNEIHDPDSIVNRSIAYSPLKGWCSIPNLFVLSLMYDLIPPNNVTAVVTDLAMLPSLTAPLVLRVVYSECGLLD